MLNILIAAIAAAITIPIVLFGGAIIVALIGAIISVIVPAFFAILIFTIVLIALKERKRAKKETLFKGVRRGE